MTFEKKKKILKDVYKALMTNKKPVGPIYDRIDISKTLDWIGNPSHVAIMFNATDCDHVSVTNAHFDTVQAIPSAIYAAISKCYNGAEGAMQVWFTTEEDAKQLYPSYREVHYRSL